MTKHKNKSKQCIIDNWPKLNRPNFRAKLAKACNLTENTLNNYISEMRREGVELEVKK